MVEPGIFARNREISGKRRATGLRGPFSHKRSLDARHHASEMWSYDGVELLGRRGGRLDLGGAELVLRDLAEWVELRVGQHVGGGFGVAERDEHLARGNGAVAARFQLDRAAPGGDANLFAGSD